MRQRRRSALLALCLGLAAVVPANAQIDTTLSVVRRLSVDSLPAPLQTYYSPGVRLRARSLQARFRSAVQFFAARFKVQQPITLAVLSEDHWSVIDSAGYGRPFVSAAPHVVVLPSLPGASVLTTQLLLVRDSAAGSHLEALARIGLTYNEAIPRTIDLTGLHELGHVAVAAFGFRDTAHWLNELLATYAAYAFLAERDPESITIWNVMSHATVRGVVPTARRLEDFDLSFAQLPPETLVWFQSHFNLRAANLLSELRGRDLFSELRAAGLLTGTGLLPTTELLDRLEKVVPGFKQWGEDLVAGR